MLWKSHPGPQSELFQLAWGAGVQAQEILYGGARGGGKSAATMAFMVRYVDHPLYKGLVLRQTSESLKEWIDFAWQTLYKPMGAKKEGNPTTFRFPSGAVIYTGHLSGDKSLDDYKGNEYWLIAVDEASQIKSHSMFERLEGSNRSPFPDYPAKLLLPTNPDGPANGWLKRLFINIIGPDGKKIAPKTLFREGDGKVRVFVPSRIYDNPVYMEGNQDYLSYLQNIENEALRKAWLDGDWDASDGAFYPEFRPLGPYKNEPAEARHVVPAHDLPPWYHRWAGVDFGYNHFTSAYWGCYDENRRIHVYDEMCVRNMDPEEFGSEWAKRSIEAINGMPDRALTMYLSHEAFGPGHQGRSTAEQIQMGIERIIGPGSCFVLGKNEEERKADKEEGKRMMEDRFVEFGSGCRVVIKRANTDRISGANMLRRLFRWRRIYKKVEADMEWAKQLLMQPNGKDLFDNYMNKFKNQQADVPVPGMWFHDKCQQLIECIPKLRPDPNRLEDVLKFHGEGGEVGDDPYDAVRYLLMGAEEQMNRMPYNEFLVKEIEKFVGKDGDLNLKIQVANQAKGRYSKDEQSSVIPSLTRGCMEARWRN